MRYDLIDNEGEVVAIVDAATDEEVSAYVLERGAVNAWPYVWPQAMFSSIAVHSSAARNWQACRRRKGSSPGHNEHVGPKFLSRDECVQWINAQTWEF